MAAGIHNIVIEQGADFSLSLTVKEDGAAKDLTGYSARAQLRPNKSSDVLSADFAASVPVPLDGEVSISLNNSVTKNLEPGIYYYDLELYTANDVIVNRLLQGKATVTAEITR